MERDPLTGLPEGVLLLKGTSWESISSELQQRLVDGTLRISAIRDAIAADARVREMPPVSVAPVVWVVPPDGIIHAASGLWPARNGGHAIGTIVAAGPALCADGDVVRAILAHEFAHCFHLATQMADLIDAGSVGTQDLTGNDTRSEERDRVLQGTPGDWLGAADSALIQWRDPRMAHMTSEVTTLANARLLPLELPPGRVAGHAVLPLEWSRHIRELRRLTQ